MDMESVSNIMYAARGKGSINGCEDEKMAAHSLMLLSHKLSSAASHFPSPSKRIMKAAKEFHSVDSPYHCEKRHICKTCGKRFVSFHALGGHRASCCNTATLAQAETEQAKEKSSKMKVHECPICWRVFSSGQALGGHKRIHSTATPPRRSLARENEGEQRPMLDLNMPAPLDMEEASIPAISDYDGYNPSLHCWMGSYGKRLLLDYNGALAFEAERGVGGDVHFKLDILGKY